MFDWAKQQQVNDLLQKKAFNPAIEILQEALKENPKDRRVRLQLADAFAAGGYRKEATESLSDLADDLALEGKAAQAIAVLKRVQSLRPGLPEIEQKMAYLINPQNPIPESWAFARLRNLPPTPEPKPLHVPEPEAPREALKPEPTAAEKAIQQSVLFKDFDAEELLAVIRGLTLKSFDPGAIIVTEGEPGGSLFVITTGRVLAFVKNATGRNVPIRELSEGDFFGEMSILSGNARSATVTAATHCDLLELDMHTLAAIEKTHPRVRNVLLDFHDQRAGNTLEAAIRAAGIPQKPARKKSAIRKKPAKEADAPAPEEG
ncbi:MAG: cyclic nucleotide-binding domain-containing protein [Acidobacteria bacterium]|nr:cyclic nucleotide-binding domain-containing protein [Acidobacteriota bacterium]